jgi:hypothetical protein
LLIAGTRAAQIYPQSEVAAGADDTLIAVSCVVLGQSPLWMNLWKLWITTQALARSWGRLAGAAV